MRVVTFTRLWPNEEQPLQGVFVQQRMERFASLTGSSLRVVAPVPWAPRLPGLPARWATAAAVPHVETHGGVRVEHPRYLVVPKIGYAWQGPSLATVAGQVLQRLAAEEPIDLVDAHFLYPDGYAAVHAARRLGLPVVVSVRGSDVNALPADRAVRRLVARTLRDTSMLIAVSRPLADGLLALGARPEKIRVVPNGVDATRFEFTPLGRDRVRHSLHVGRMERLVLAVARLERVKGLDVLVDAAAALSRRPGAPPFRIAIVGEGSQRAALESRARAAGLSARLHLVGPIDHALLAEWYSAADVFCLPSRAEGYPNALLEALACGTPAIGSDVGAVSELIAGRAGLVVPPEDPAALADGLGRVFEGIHAGDFPRAKVRADVAGRSWDVVAEGVRDVFHEALAHPPGEWRAA